MSERVLRNGKNPGFLVPEAAQPGTPGALGWKRMQKDRERRQMGVYWLPAERQNGNSGLLNVQTVQREHLASHSHIGAAVNVEAGKNGSIF